MILTSFVKIPLYNGNIYGNDPDVYKVGDLDIHIAIDGNFIELSYNIKDKDDKYIFGQVSTEILPKRLAQILMEMTNYGASKT